MSFQSRLDGLAALQERSPWRFVLASLLCGLLSLPVIVGVGPLGDGLSMNSDFTALLPESARSVRDLAEIQERFGGQQPITIAIQAPTDDLEPVYALMRDLAPRVESLGEEHRVVSLDWNVSDFTRFIEEHRHLYADLDDLEAMRDTLQARLDHERAVANPFYIDLEDEEPADPQETIDRLEADAEAAREELERQFPGGFIQDTEARIVLMVVHTRINGGDLDRTRGLRAAIDREIAALDPDSYAEGIVVRYGGALVDIQGETESLIAAVRNATLLTVGLVMLAIWVFFLRVRPIPLLTLALVPPLLVTFAFAELTVDYLNASSAFLSAIVVGNGINPNVIWLARYFEARRDGASASEALRLSHRGTWRGTLTASLAAGVAYGSLISTDYRGFRDFGMIGGMGMLLCWLAAYLVLPALTVLFERARPLKFRAGPKHRGVYGVLFARLALGSPKGVLAVSALTTAAAIGLVAWAGVNDPMEHDFRRLRSERDADDPAEVVAGAMGNALDDTKSGSALAVLARRQEDVPGFAAQLAAYEEAHPEAIGEVETIDGLLPTQQAEKLPVLAELRALMLELRPHVDDELGAQIDDHIPPEDARALTYADLPPGVARPFTERDGTRGRLFFVEHAMSQNAWDAAYITRWAAAPRSLRADGADEPPPIAGTAVVFADLMTTIWSDGPRATGVAFLATALLLLLTFRRNKDRALTLAALLVGILWMAATMAVFGMRLNFLNFVAFPITFGNGVDYAVNVMRRYADEDGKHACAKDAVRSAVEGTGGAVILCSLTTVIGYISLYTSANQALNSFGAAMAISEVTCLAAAVLALPAALYLVDRRSETLAETASSRAASVAGDGARVDV